MGGHRRTRRDFIASFAALSVSAPPVKAPLLPSFRSERLRYADPATEFPVVRLTSPENASFLPPACHRSVSRRAAFLLFSSARSGSPQLMQMFLNTGEARQLAESAALDPSSVVLSADDRSAFFFDGPALRRIGFNPLRAAEVYRVPDGWSRAPGGSISNDGSQAYLVESQAERWRLRAVPLLAKGGDAVTLIEQASPLRDPLPQPGHADVLYRDGDGFLALAGGHDRRRLPLAPGRSGSAFWTADGDRLLYLNLPAAGGRLNAIREWTAEDNSERLVANTSQYASFAPNADASVFVGASANKASPYVVLMLRVTHRELPLCEHRASDPAAVSPRFSPDSQRVFFQTDRDGGSAICMMDVQRLVERTEA
jgi:oligogalacturonide lyase